MLTKESFVRGLLRSWSEVKGMSSSGNSLPEALWVGWSHPEQRTLLAGWVCVVCGGFMTSVCPRFFSRSTR